MPDGKHFIFASSGVAERTGIFLASLEKNSKEAPVRLLPDISNLAYAPSPDPSLGYLLFVRVSSDNQGTLMAQPMSVAGNRLIGEPLPVAEKVNFGSFSVSQTGVLVHSANNALGSSTAAGTRGVLTWLDRTGKVLGTVGQTQSYSLNINISPDGTRVATAHGGDVYVFELARGVDNRLTFEPGEETAPQWNRDGSRVVYTALSSSEQRITEKPANGAGATTLLFSYTGTGRLTPGGWSPDGRFLALSTSSGSPGADAFLITAEGTPQTRKLMPLVKGPFNERGVRFAPNGKFFSYTSDETGKDEAYVRPFDPATGAIPDGQWMISKGGGVSPHWSGDGKEMFYMSPDGKLMAVEIDMRSGFQPFEAKPLFQVPAAIRFWDVSRDGQKFLVPVPESVASVEPYRIVLNWTSLLKK
jgi:Tol biopolymer transport system component